MKKLSIISNFYNQQAEVKKQVAYWQTFPQALKDNVEFILIDDGSEVEFRIDAPDLDLHFYRITTDIPWNLSGGRNLGGYVACSEWCLYFDIDQKIFAEPLAQILHNIHLLDPLTMYHLKVQNFIDSNTKTELEFATSTFLVNNHNFKFMARYDEDFVGHYGYEDLYMIKVWEANGGRRTLLNDMYYFEDVGIKTENLSRDLSRNQNLAQTKMAAGFENSPGMLRFKWKKIV